MKNILARRHFVWLIIAAWVYTFTFIFNNYWSKYASYGSVTKSFQASVTKRENAFQNWVKDTAMLQELSNGIKSAKSLKQTKDLPFFTFLYNTNDTSDVPVFWSTNAVIPDAYHVSFYPSGTYIKLGNGQYELLKRQVILNKTEYTVIALIQLHEEFFIQNGNLRREYPGFAGLGDKMELTIDPTIYPIKGENNKAIVYFHPLVKEPIYIFNWLSFIIQSLATALLIIFITKWVDELIKRNFLLGLLTFAGIFITLRITVAQFGFPVDFRQFPLFADESALNVKNTEQLRSFLVHSLFGLWGGIFLTTNTVYILGYFSRLRLFAKWIVLGLLFIIITIGHFVLVFMVRDLYLNSTIAFDITNFFNFNFTTVLSFLIIFMLCVSHYMTLRFSVLAMLRLSLANHWVILLLSSIPGLVYLSVISQKNIVFPLLIALVWLLLFIWAGLTRVIKPALTSSGVVLAWLFIYSMTICIFLSLLSDSRLHTRAHNIGLSLLLQKDKTSEKLMKIAALDIKRVDWSSFIHSFTSEADAHAKKDSVINEYFGGYLDRFNTNLYLFDRNKISIYNSRDVTYETLNTLYSTQASVIDEEDSLAYFGESFDQFGYIIKREVRDKQTQSLQGYLFIMIRSLRSGNQAFSPELFRQLQNFAIVLPEDYSYAWYKNGILVEQFRNYPFQTNLPAAMRGKRSLWESKTADAYELWMNGGSDTVLVIAAQRNVFISFISMLAYLFGAFLIFYFLFAVASALLKGSLFSGEAFEKINFNLQNKIRLTVVAILTVSFVIVAVVTISFFISQFKSDNTEKLAQSVQTVSTELAKRLPDDFDTYPAPTRKAVLQNTLSSITKGQNVDVNCFDNNGILIASTQNILYEKGVISPMADPLVWWNLTREEVHRYFSNETIGDLSYSSIYQPLLNKKNKIVLYLQVPFFASQSELNKEISNFLVILINIIAFVFLLSGSLAYWISGSITRSFNVIADKMDRIRLSEHNERIEWTPKDEIGNLVFQYNKMVDQLEDSAKKMARTEREMAWREMAKQVAHEIKNPLTPMKLSLQFLQRAIKENNEDVVQITEKVASNLVGQIDHLSKIATEFSQFANLGNYKPELFNLQLVLGNVVQMYEMQENISLRWNSLSQPLEIFADKTQVNRLFTNLLQNASESGDKSKIINVTVGEKLVPGSVILSFKDDGNGIPESARSNIFMPNFTTKSSGTGLGLSICKAIVENAGGTIWFETEAGVGTSFYVKLPLSK